MLGRVQAYLAMAGAAVVALAMAFFRGRAEGTRAAWRDAVAKEREHVREMQKRADEARLDFDAGDAAAQLRKAGKLRD